MPIPEFIAETKSVSGKVIRLTFRQWFHIIESHDYMAGNLEIILETVNTPDIVVKGMKDEFLAMKHYKKTNITEKSSVVVYKENDDGFIITAFFTSQPQRIRKRATVWQK